MNLQKLFNMQHKLDERIVNDHLLEGQDLLPNKILALRVEIGELANDWQGFKYWKVDSSPKQGVLEEYADCLHFLLSIGLDLGFDNSVHSIHGSFLMLDVIEQFEAIYDQISTLKLRRTIDSYQNLLEFFLGLGDMLGFTPEMIEAAYLMKNKVNHERQASSY